MTSVTQIERDRLAAQAQLDSLRNSEERNRAGQFATPPGLALEIATYARRLWRGGETGVRFLDPALGTGSFYSALRQVFANVRIDEATGVELDPLFAATAARLWRGSGLRVLAADFTRLRPPLPGHLPNLVLTNPPYVRHHHLIRTEKVRLQAAVARELGIRVSGLAGLYCYFLLLGDRWLADGGLAAWLIPSEFMDVNYGNAVKRYLTERVTLQHVHRFSPVEVQFDDALVSSAVVVFEKRPPYRGHTVALTLGGTLLLPTLHEQVSLAALRGARKWTAFPQDRTALAPIQTPLATLGDLFTIKRGLATGANDFFILEREKAARSGVPAAFVKPVLPSPRHLKEQVMETCADGYPALEPALCLIDCEVPQARLHAAYPRFWNFLADGMRRNVHRGYLASRRTPWYSQEPREPAPFLCTYMGRASKGRKPFRFIWNKSRAVASNLYLMLYPREPLRSALVADSSLYEAVFAALQKIDTETFLREGRVYGGGLYKMEPKELGRLPADVVLAALPKPMSVRPGSLFSDV